MGGWGFTREEDRKEVCMRKKMRYRGEDRSKVSECMRLEFDRIDIWNINTVELQRIDVYPIRHLTTIIEPIPNTVLVIIDSNDLPPNRGSPFWVEISVVSVYLLNFSATFWHQEYTDLLGSSEQNFSLQVLQVHSRGQSRLTEFNNIMLFIGNSEFRVLEPESIIKYEQPYSNNTCFISFGQEGFPGYLNAGIDPTCCEIILGR